MLLRSLAYIVCKVFFKTISISGIPHTGKGSLWIANHTSGIVDPCVLIGLAPVRLRPLAKHTLWDIPAMRLFLKLSRAIPVKRVKDISVLEEQFREERHRDMFSETTKALLSGSNILIFPEGLSHDEPHIFRLKNGVARMALQALNASKNSKVSIVIQPVAIDYSEKDEFRSDLCIHYCEPVTVSSQDFQIKDIMLGVRESLEKNLATFFSWDEKRNWRFLFELAYERPPFSSREFRVFVEKHREGFDNSPDILARIQTIRRLMQVRNLSPSQMSWAEKHHTKKEHFIIILKHIWFYLFISIPFRFLGALVWGLPYKLCESLSNMSPYGRDVKATMKITHGFYIFPAWSLIIAFLLSSYLNDIFPEFNLLILWLLSFVAGPIFLLLSVILSTTLYFFPGYWELAKLRLFFPRAWTELMLEWKEITELVVNKMDG